MAVWMKGILVSPIGMDWSNPIGIFLPRPGVLLIWGLPVADSGASMGVLSGSVLVGVSKPLVFISVYESRVTL